SLKNEKGKNPALSLAAVIHEGFGDTGDGEPEEYVAHDWINEKNRSQKFKKNYADVSPVENENEISKVPKEDELRESEEEGMKTTLKGKAVVPPAGSPPVVSEIPLRFPSPCPNQRPKSIENSASSPYYTSLKMRVLRVPQHIGK
ncbi:UNVERIFIED_CONTAM: hypothetical protein Sangu_2034500, partial [Sesamum angustifolium]